MSISVMNEAWQVQLNNPITKLVLLKLADNANEDDRTCWPAMSSICIHVGISRRTAQRHIKVLEDLGLVIKRERRSSLGAKASNLYFVLPTEDILEKYSDDGGACVTDAHASPVTHACVTVETRPCVTADTCKTSEPSINHQITYMSDFDEFWGEYPKRKGSNPRKKAFEKYTAARKAGASKDDILDGVKRFFEFTCTEDTIETEFVPMASTWLSQERWSDEI